MANAPRLIEKVFFLCPGGWDEAGQLPITTGPVRRMRIYPVFMPHRGCPFQCVYCNQHVVTSRGSEEGGAEAGGDRSRASMEELAAHARLSGVAGEIAFYGGTFTALPLTLMGELLERAARWVGEGLFTGIRFSTRPDAMSEEVCDFLGDYPVRTVELGAQSLSDEVLALSRRGYCVETVGRAAERVHEHGWALGIQMMPGLPGDTKAVFLDSIRKAMELGPSFLRIYPTLVLSGTVLAEWYRNGLYKPLSLKEAIDWCAPAYETLMGAGAPVARMGLHADAELEKPGRILAGPYHPSFGYLVRVRWWRERVDRYVGGVERAPEGQRWVLRVPERLISEALGPGRSNITHWKKKWGWADMRVRGESEWPPTRFECVPE